MPDTQSCRGSASPGWHRGRDPMLHQASLVQLVPQGGESLVGLANLVDQRLPLVVASQASEDFLHLAEMPRRDLVVPPAAPIDSLLRARAVNRQFARAQKGIDGRSRGNYQIAAGHLSQVKEILTRLGRHDEWKALINEVRETNKRLPALRDELDKAGLV